MRVPGRADRHREEAAGSVRAGPLALRRLRRESHVGDWAHGSQRQDEGRAVRLHGEPKDEVRSLPHGARARQVPEVRCGMSSPTARSLGHLRKRGWMAHVVEKRNPFTKKLNDCFGADIIAIHPARKEVLWVQATSGSNHSARVKKCKSNPEVAVILITGHRFEVWSWKKEQGRWKLREEKLELGDLQRVEAGV